MLDNIPTIYVFGPAMVIGSIIMVYLRKRRNNQLTSEFDKAIGHFKTTTIIFGILSVILWFLLSTSASISSFGYPKDITSIGTDSERLYYMQKYSSAIERTSDVLKWFMFLFIWWFLVTLYGVVNALKGNIVHIEERQAA